MSRRALAYAISTLAFPGIAAAYQNRPAAAPTTQTQPIAGEAQAIQGTITGVEGTVQVRIAEGQPWQTAKVGMAVDEGAEFRTGLRSAVRIEIPGGHTITLDRLGVMKLLDAVRSGNKIKTDVGMPYGRVRYDIEAAGEEHDSTIHSPGGTLAIRGTEVSLFECAGFPQVATSLTGKAKYRDFHGHTSSVGGKGAGKSKLVGGSGGAAQTALHTTFVDPTSGNAHTSDEQNAILATPLVSGFSLGQSLTTVSAPLVATVPTAASTPGSLIFQLVWVPSTPSASPADLDLFVTSPRGEQLCPKGCPATVASGGISPTNDIATTGRAGQEIATWRNSFPVGSFEYAAKHVSGGSAEFQLLVFQNGQLAGDPQSGTIDSQNNWASFNFDAVPSQSTAKTAKTSRIPSLPLAKNSSATIRPQTLGVRR